MRSDRPQWGWGLKLGFDTLETGVVSKKEWGRNRGNHLGAGIQVLWNQKWVFFFLFGRTELETCFN